jgi:hypothetical protein
VQLMVNSDPPDRDGVKGIYRRHEWSDEFDAYWYKIYPEGRENDVRASQMDMLNNRTAWGYATKGIARKRKDQHFCNWSKEAAAHAKYIGPFTSPYAWASIHPDQKFFRAVFRKVKDDNGVKVTLRGRSCGAA